MRKIYLKDCVFIASCISADTIYNYYIHKALVSLGSNLVFKSFISISTYASVFKLINKLPIAELKPAAIPVIITAFGTFYTSSGVKNLYSYNPLNIVSVAC